MTDDEKLALLDEGESDAWTYLSVEHPVVEKALPALEFIERCQRIRAGLKKPVLTVTNLGVYQRSSSGDEGF